MKELVCIVCPNGCKLKIKQERGEYIVEGNKCLRGIDFAIAELTHPVRTISSTVKTTYSQFPVLPVKVSKEIDKDSIFKVMQEINKVQVTTRVGQGDIIIKDVLGLGADVVCTSNILKGEKEDE